MHCLEVDFRSARARAICLAVLLLLAATILPAQSSNGEIRVQVKDPSGATMEASGILENLGSGVRSSFKTSTGGTYRLGNLPYGRYRLEISRSGFATQSEQIEVRSEKPITRTITMALASQVYKTDVVSATPLAGTDLTAEQIASPVQTATAADIRNSGALDLSEFMNRR